MKHSNKARALTIVAAFAFALAAGSTAKAANRGCSNATLQGTYSDSDIGTIIGAGLFVGVNLDTFDGKGNLSVSGMSSVNGSISALAASGAYTVNPDCTGTCTVSDSVGDTFQSFFVIDQGGNELQIVIQTQAP